MHGDAVFARGSEGDDMTVWRLVRVFALILALALVVTVKLIRDVGLRTPEPPGQVGTESRSTSSATFLKIVHLDLKGGPPRLAYLENVIRLAREAGANALLVEYEDAFPYAGRLVNISGRRTYSAEEVSGFVEAARAAGMEVIPLVQTFGHLEHVLKLEEFRHLREDPNYPQEICPSNGEAVSLVKEMIRQVMALHKNSKYLHIGCDEVRHLGKCPHCSRTKAKKIFSRHVYRMGSFVRGTYPGVVPLIWDDMMRGWSIHDVRDSGLTSVVEPVVWVYAEDIPHLVPHYLWYIYFQSFPRVWAASAFKGSTGETEVVPDLSRHFANTLAWIRFIKNRKDRVDASIDIFGGIVLTGWSRYDHFAIMCELLPAGLPSLLLNLALVDRNFNDGRIDPLVTTDRGIFRKWLQLLRCPRSVPEGDDSVIKNRRYQAGLQVCNFPGNAVYALGFEYLVLKERVKRIVDGVEESAWVSRYNVRRNYTSPWRVGQVLTADFEDVTLKAVGMLKSSLVEAMSEVYEDWVTQEWIEERIEPMEAKLNEMRRSLRDLMKRDSWPRRPLP